MIGRNDSLENMAYTESDSEYSLLIDKQPIVCADGLMMKCTIVDQSYVPQQIINFQEFIASIKRAIEALKTPENSPDLGCRYENESASLHRTSSFGECSQSQVMTSPLLRRANSTGYSRSRSSSLKTAKSPQSILLKVALKPKDIDDAGCVENEEKVTEEERYLKEKFKAQIKGFNETNTDYVYMESLRSITEASAILGAIIDNKAPTVIDMEICSESCMTICYQAITNFKQEFMMLKLKSDYCLFLAPF